MCSLKENLLSTMTPKCLLLVTCFRGFPPICIVAWLRPGLVNSVISVFASEIWKPTHWRLAKCGDPLSKEWIHSSIIICDTSLMPIIRPWYLMCISSSNGYWIVCNTYRHPELNKHHTGVVLHRYMAKVFQKI